MKFFRGEKAAAIHLRRPSSLHVGAAFAAVYLIWGSTYLAIRFAIETLPPFFMAGARFILAGAVLQAQPGHEGRRRMARDSGTNLSLQAPVSEGAPWTAKGLPAATGVRRSVWAVNGDVAWDEAEGAEAKAVDLTGQQLRARRINRGNFAGVPDALTAGQAAGDKACVRLEIVHDLGEAAEVHYL